MPRFEFPPQSKIFLDFLQIAYMRTSGREDLWQREKRSQHWYKSVWKLLWYLVMIWSNLSWLFFSQVLHFLRIDYWYLGELDDKWKIPPSVPLPQHPIQKKENRTPSLVPVVEYLEFSCWDFMLNLLLKEIVSSLIMLNY